MENPLNPTRLMYATNLSWAPLQECLKVLIAQGALVESESRSNRKVYSLTKKGRSLISRYNEFAKEIIPLYNDNGKTERESDLAMLY